MRHVCHDDPRVRAAPAFTLVELLVVIAIIATLVGLLLPAVQSAREAARRVQCQNNMKQLALAVIGHEGGRKTFPAAATGLPNIMPSSSEVAAKRANWVVTVLPYLEEQALLDSFDLTKSPCDEVNKRARGTKVTAMLCPSDAFNQQPFMASQGGEARAYGDGWARGNYGANSSLRLLGNYGEASGSTDDGWADATRRGVMGFNKGVRTAEITDGLTKTAILLELRAGITPYDGRGVWALGQPGASSLWAHGGYFHDANGPNSPCATADDVINCAQIRNATGGADALGRKGMGCWPGGGGEWWQGAAPRSMHAGGIFMAMADGSVQWVSDFIDVMPSWPGSFSVWDRLMLSADGMTVNVGEY